MERAIRPSTPVAGCVLLPRQSDSVSFSLHLAARDAAALSLRSVDEFWLEVSGAPGNYQYLFYRNTSVGGRVGLREQSFEHVGRLSRVSYSMFCGLQRSLS